MDEINWPRDIHFPEKKPYKNGATTQKIFNSWTLEQAVQKYWLEIVKKDTIAETHLKYVLQLKKNKII